MNGLPSERDPYYHYALYDNSVSCGKSKWQFFILVIFGPHCEFLVSPVTRIDGYVEACIMEVDSHESFCSLKR